MVFGIENTPKAKSWTKLLLEESEFSLKAKHTKRERTFRRMYMTVFVLFGSAFLVICSLFYVGAFVDVGKVVGVSQSDRAEKAKSKVSMSTGEQKSGIFTSFANLMTIDRIYMRSGQSILATYEVPKGAEMTLTIKQCDSKPIIEVFNCQLVGEQTKVIKNKTTGFIRFTVVNPGFYHFGDNVKLRRSGEVQDQSKYRIVWRRD